MNFDGWCDFSFSFYISPEYFQINIFINPLIVVDKYTYNYFVNNNLDINFVFGPHSIGFPPFSRFNNYLIRAPQSAPITSDYINMLSITKRYPQKYIYIYIFARLMFIKKLTNRKGNRWKFKRSESRVSTEWSTRFT